MSEEMGKFLEELKLLLEKNNACFLRSANNTNDLVISLMTKKGFENLHCEEELNADDIRFKRFKSL